MSQEISNNQDIVNNIGNSLGEETEVSGEHNIDARDLEHGETASDEHAEHEHTLYAETLFSLGDFHVTNSLLTSWLAVFLIIILSLVIRVRNSRVPSKFQSFIETVIDGSYGMMDMVTGDRQKSERIFPVIFSIFIFILINNWLGLFPGIGSLTYNGTALLRGGTADLNTTLALGIFGVLAANVFGVIVVGGWNWFNKFVNLKTLMEIPKRITKEPTVVLINPINFFVGLVEIISEVAKVASLSFRLFGNVFLARFFWLPYQLC